MRKNPNRQKFVETPHKDNFRCWGILTATFPEQVLEFLVRRLDTLPGTSITRVRALKVIQYLINYETEIIKDNSNLVLRSLLPLQSSTNLQIRLQLLNVAQEKVSNTVFISQKFIFNTVKNLLKGPSIKPTAHRTR